MEWLSAENLVAVAVAVAVATAMLGIVASAVMVRYERRVPRRRRIGYRVQLDVPIGDDQRSGRRINRRVGWFDTAAGMTDASIVLLRIENDGSGTIGRDDYQSPGTHGMTVDFGGRSILGVSVTQPSAAGHLVEHFTPDRGFGHQSGTLDLPRAPLNRGPTSNSWCCSPAAARATGSSCAAT